MALRDDKTVYWVSIGHYEWVEVGHQYDTGSVEGIYAFYILNNVEIWTGVTDADSLTDNFER